MKIKKESKFAKKCTTGGEKLGLENKLLNLKEREQKDTIEELKGIQMDIAWGSQIRSYVFCPYTMVKDHRTNYEVGNVQAVMDGEIDCFMESYLKMKQ